MSLLETPMTLWYWAEMIREGALITEFMAVPRAPGQGRRLVDGLVILGEPKQRLRAGIRPDIAGKDVVVLQAKNKRLGMNVAGQTLFSAMLVKRLGARSVQSVALVRDTDAILQPMLEGFDGCKVVVCPPEVCRRTPPPSDIEET